MKAIRGDGPSPSGALRLLRRQLDDPVDAFGGIVDRHLHHRMTLLDDEAGGLRRLFGHVERFSLAVDLESVVAGLFLGGLAGRRLRLLGLGFLHLDLGWRSPVVMSILGVLTAGLAMTGARGDAAALGS